MKEKSNIFLNKKILVYGLGKSGISAFNFLKKNNKIYLFDDFKKIKKNKTLKKKFISFNIIKKNKFDAIILSPGIDLNKCKLKTYLKKNKKIIYTDLDIFYSFYKNQCITITGTNGKSTTCQLLYEFLKKQKYNVKLAGNIGYPILSIRNISPKSIFVIEASSYQLEYSKLFKSKYSAILNIKPDHLERHKNLKNYISAKLKLIKNRSLNSTTFINKYDENTRNSLKKIKFKGKVIQVNTKLNMKKLNIYKNDYLLSISNKENLLFVLQVAKKFKIKKNIIKKVIKNFKGLKYRQQVIYNKNNISIINDSKSTSYASSIEMLKNSKKIYWLVGGIPKKGDKFTLPKKYFQNIKVFIFGKNYKKFLLDFKDKIKFNRFLSLKDALERAFSEIKRDKIKKKIILFSPSAASFDDFKNFEDRGLYFDKLIKKYFHE